MSTHDIINNRRGLEKEAGRLARLLLDRLLFLYFIQKKGWLNNEPDYLTITEETLGEYDQEIDSLFFSAFSLSMSERTAVGEFLKREG